MDKPVTITFPSSRAYAYVRALELTIDLCMKDPKHWNAADFLAELRAELIEAYAEHDENITPVGTGS